MENPARAVFEPLTQRVADNPGQHSVEFLEQAITVGSILLEGHRLALFIGLLFVGLFIWLVCKQHYFQQRSLVAMRTLMMTLQSLDEQIKGLNRPGQDEAHTATGISFAGLESAVQCVDAKVLNLNKALEEIMQSGPSIAAIEKNTNASMEMVQQHGTVLQTWGKEVPPRIKEMYGFTSILPSLNKAIQAMALDTAKQFSLQETLSDGLLRQGRESLHHLQGEQRAQAEKLTEIKSLVEEQKGSDKQLSLDIHVSRTRAEQKLDTLQKDLSNFSSWSQSAIRGLNVLVPNSKDLKERIDNAVDYLARNHTHNERAAENGQILAESTANTEQRALRIEQIMVGLQDAVNELQDICLQIKESQNMVQEQIQTLLERTPKLPPRRPPQQDAPSGPPSGSSQPGQAQQAPGQAPQIPMEASQPIRLSEHLQPVLQRGDPHIYMMQDPLRGVSTGDLLRTLLARGNF